MSKNKKRIISVIIGICAIALIWVLAVEASKVMLKHHVPGSPFNMSPHDLVRP